MNLVWSNLVSTAHTWYSFRCVSETEDGRHSFIQWNFRDRALWTCNSWLFPSRQRTVDMNFYFVSFFGFSDLNITKSIVMGLIRAPRRKRFGKEQRVQRSGSWLQLKTPWTDWPFFTPHLSLPYSVEKLKHHLHLCTIRYTTARYCIATYLPNSFIRLYFLFLMQYISATPRTVHQGSPLLNFHQPAINW